MLLARSIRSFGSGRLSLSEIVQTPLPLGAMPPPHEKMKPTGSGGSDTHQQQRTARSRTSRRPASPGPAPSPLPPGPLPPDALPPGPPGALPPGALPPIAWLTDTLGWMETRIWLQEVLSEPEIERLMRIIWHHGWATLLLPYEDHGSIYAREHMLGRLPWSMASGFMIRKYTRAYAVWVGYVQLRLTPSGWAPPQRPQADAAANRTILI